MGAADELEAVLLTLRRYGLLERATHINIDGTVIELAPARPEPIAEVEAEHPPSEDELLGFTLAQPTRLR